MRNKFMELMGWCWELNKRTKYKPFINYSAFSYEDITMGFYDEKLVKYILMCERLSLEKLDDAIEIIKELLNESIH